MATYDDCPDIVRDYLFYLLTILGRSRKTVDEYHLDLRHMLRFVTLHKSALPKSTKLCDVDISKLTIDDISKITLSDLYEFIIYAMQTLGNNEKTRARKITSIKGFFNYLENKKKILPNNPAKDLDTPKLKKSLPVYLTLDESSQLLNAIDGEFYERDYLIITLFLNCGLRLSELCGINISDIRGDTLKVLGKGNKERTIYLNNACKNALEAYLKVRPCDNLYDKDALFISKRYTRLSHNTVQYTVKKFLKKAGLDTKKYSAHKLRHTAATLMYQYGNVDVRILQEILGHEQLNTTQIYTHVSNEQIKKAAEKNPLSEIKPKNKP